MTDQFAKYTAKLLRDGTADPASIRFFRLDDAVTASAQDEWTPLFTQVFGGLDITAICFARTSLPFADLLIRRAGPANSKLVPNDSETRVFLHDIPFIRRSDWEDRPPAGRAPLIIESLKERKAVIIEDLGVVATGAVTVEQAFIGFSTIFHTTFVKYLLDLLTEGFRFPGEREAFADFRRNWLKESDLSGLSFSGELPPIRDAIRGEICRVGRYTVEKGFVDSFFGNISYFDGTTIHISQTASSLDELEGHIDPVPLDYSSTAGLSASSELPAHRAIYRATDFRAILHGHPKFSVIMSMFCEEKDCAVKDCNRFCDRKRSVAGIPVVAGETGTGGLAKSVPQAIAGQGVCIVYGHGIFAAGRTGFGEAFARMADAENRCRQAYFDLLDRLQQQQKNPLTRNG
ncbi:MAG: class II aldolase/adducin family protein [Nitrospiraceae bacterium]|nr:class II aldolase/adducin family protein [Nitrospiraceae bacterium]